MPKIRGVRPEYWTDEDIVELSLPARLLFIGLWNFACDNGHLDDKPKQIKMRVLPADEVDVDALLDELAWHRRLTRDAGTITIRKFAHHQKPHKRWWVTCDLASCVVPEHDPQQETHGGKARAKRADNGGSTVEPREANGGPTADGDGDGDGELMVRVTPSRALARTDDDRPELAALCDLLADAIANNGSKRPTVSKRWLDSVRLMIDSDGRDPNEIRGAIAWCQADEFWRSNILSMPKLREKYDQLRLAAQRPTRGNRQQETDDLFDRAMARARAMGETA